MPGRQVAAAEALAARVAADYSIAYAGIDIGNFQFRSKIEGSSYELRSRSRVKLLFGVFKWGSGSLTEGEIGAEAAPKSFSFDYQIKEKRKSNRVRFRGGHAVAVENEPRVRYTNEHVPLQPKHLKGVVDPMTAIMELTRGGQRNPCRRSAEIFDGKRRFRLELSPKGRQVINETKSGQPRFGYVCRISYTPIAGHKKSKQVARLARSRDLEIVLRPVPSANIVVPYKILVPTGFGTVSITADSVAIINSRNQKIAMRY